MDFACCQVDEDRRVSANVSDSSLQIHHLVNWKSRKSQWRTKKIAGNEMQERTMTDESAGHGTGGRKCRWQQCVTQQVHIFCRVITYIICVCLDCINLALFIHLPVQVITPHTHIHDLWYSCKFLVLLHASLCYLVKHQCPKTSDILKIMLWLMINPKQSSCTFEVWWIFNSHIFTNLFLCLPVKKLFKLGEHLALAIFSTAVSYCCSDNRVTICPSLSCLSLPCPTLSCPATDNMLQIVEAHPNWPVYADIFEHPSPWLASWRHPIWSDMTSVDTITTGFCGQPHYCYRPYYPTARFQSPSSYGLWW